MYTNKEYYLENRDWLIQQNRDRYKKTREKGLSSPLLDARLCNKCGRKKMRDGFTKNLSIIGGLHYNCKDCESARWHYRNAKVRDQKRGYKTCSFNEYLGVLAIGKCSYCGYRKNLGADRLDNSKGHELSNIVACCDYCNIARSDHFTPDEMIRFVGPGIRAARKNREDKNGN